MMYRQIFLLILSLFVFCQGEPICTPTSQCRDFWIAKKCNTVDQCIKEDWASLKPTGYKDDVCSICLRMVKEARDTLQSNETRDELRQVLEGSCNLLILKPAKELCDKLVDQLGDELVKVLASQMDPETVCSVAKLCNNNAFSLIQKNSKNCVNCQSFMQIMGEEMNSLSFDKFKNEILHVCRHAGGFSDACSHLGLVNARSLYDTGKSALERKPCEATLLCPTSNSNSYSVTKVGSQMCPLCKTVMRSVRDQLLRVKSAEEFSENMLEICEKLNIGSGVCSEISSKGFYEKLKSFQKLPDMFCHVVYCMEREHEDVPMWPLVPADPESFNSTDMSLFDLMAFVNLLEVQGEETTTTRPRPTIAFGDPIENPVFMSPVIPSKVLGSEDECETCQNVLDALSKPSWKDGDENKKFSVICEELEDGEKCKRFVEKYEEFLTGAYASGILSKDLCTDLMPSCQVKQSETKVDSCGLCLNVMNVFKQGDSVLLGPGLEEKCESFLGKSKNVCRDLSSTFVSLVSLLKTSTEKDACNFVKLCEPSSEVQSLNSGSYCSTCMLTFESLRDAMRSDMADGTIETILDSLCDLLPHSEKNLCYNLIRNVGVDGFKRLIQNISPSTICKELHICKRDNDDAVKTATEVIIKETSEKVPCKFCMMAIKMLLDQLQDNKTEEQIRKALDSLCNYFPEETKDTCRNLINEYTDTIIDMIIADFNATEICIYLKLCPAQLLLGNEKYGIVYNVDTNEIQDWNEYKTESTSEREKEVSRAFQQFHSAVEKCALCEALVGVISKHKNMLNRDYDFDANSDVICSIVPNNKLRQCKSLLVSYGPSIVNLIVDHNVDPDQVCIFIDLCSRNMQAKVDQPVSVPEPKVVSKENECLRGPVFWCANAENAKKCGTYLHCKETVWKTWQSPISEPNKNL